MDDRGKDEMNRNRYVGVIGAGSCSEAIYELATEVGHEIGKRGWGKRET